MKRFSLLASLFLILGLALAGCGKSETAGNNAAPELVELAKQNKQVIEKLEPLKKGIENIYKDMEAGKMTPEQMALALDQSLVEIEQIKTAYLNYIDEHPVSEEIKQNPVYSEGISNATKALTDVLTFVRPAVKGKLEIQNDGSQKNVPMSKQELQDIYKSELLDDYNTHVEKFNEAYSSLKI